MTFLGQPHHDPSELYVSDPHPHRGDTVELRVRVPAGQVAAVHLRHMHDGEAAFVAAAPTDGPGPDEWWAARVLVDNLTLQYRWFLVMADGGTAWLNGSGVHRRDVTDAADFRLITTAAPAWVADAVVYQVFPDRFARSARADERPTPEWAHGARWDEPLRTYDQQQHRQIYGGDLDGIIERLDHIASLGATVLYLTPAFPADTNHRYNASTFDRIDDLLGGDDAMRRLIDACHARGIRVMGDFTANHTGATHEWFLAAQNDGNAPERDFYYWTDEYPGYACWLGFKSLPKLNHASPGLTERLYGEDGVIRRWLRFGLDGWRIDVANMTGRLGGIDLNREVAARTRAAVDAEGDRWLVAEHFYDLHHDVDGSTWHGAMNYAAFSRPVWGWLERPSTNAEDAHFSVTRLLPSIDGPAMIETMAEFMAQVPWAVTTASFNIVGSHDTGRIRWRVGDEGRAIAALGLAHTLPGVPMVYYGDEIGLVGETGEYGRRPFPWQAEETWATGTLQAVRELGALRRDSHALRHGALRWIGATEDAVAFVRESRQGSALVVAAREATGQKTVPTALLPGIESGRLALGSGIRVEGNQVVMEAERGGIAVWVW